MKDCLPDYIVWKITETEEELRDSLSHPEYFAEKVANLKPGSRRMLEVLAVRRALKELFYGEEQLVVYDEHGKPALKSIMSEKSGVSCVDGEEKIPYISISHTDGYAAVITSEEPVGIDIERIGKRVERVVSHFLQPQELVTLSLYEDQIPALHLAWSAKEAAFKILGQDYYDLQHLTTIMHIDTSRKMMMMSVADWEKPLTIHYDFTEEYVLAWLEAKEQERRNTN